MKKNILLFSLACLLGTITLASCGEPTSSEPTSQTTTDTQTTTEDPTTSDTSTSEPTTSQSTTDPTTEPTTISESTTTYKSNVNRVVKAIKYVKGLKYVYNKNEILDVSSVIAYVEYEGSEILDEVSANRLSFSTNSKYGWTGSTGKYSFTTNYRGVSISTDYYVIDHQAEIESIDFPTYIQRFNANKLKSFKDKNVTYSVGCQNEMNILPEITAIYLDSDGELIDVTLDSYIGDTSLFLDNSETALSGSELESYATIDDVNAKIKFTEKAVGHNFTIKLHVKGKSETSASFNKSFEVQVENALNVFDQNSLSYLDNTNTKWNEYRTSVGLENNVNPNGLILHTDIDLAIEKMPSSFFYLDGDEDLSPSDSDYALANGSLRDYVSIYLRTGTKGFTFNGNLFGIDASSLPLVIRPNGDIKADDAGGFSHSNLIAFGNNKLEPSTQIESINFKNFSSIGNAPRSGNIKNAGGLIMTKTRNVGIAEFKNLNTNSFLISNMAEFTCTKYSIKDSIIDNSFSTSLYNYGCEDYVVTNSTLTSCGGPLIITDMVGKINETHYDGNTTFVDCELESWVTGTEAWFTVTGATAVATNLIQLASLLKAWQCSSYVKEEVDGDVTKTKVNAIAVNKSSSAEGISTNLAAGKTTITTSVELETAVPNIDLQSPTALSFLQKYQGAYPLFTDDGVSFAYIKTNDAQYPMYKFTADQSEELVGPKFLIGDYTNIYFGTIGIVLKNYVAE